jgi:pimeloyl-ACP methyl ester carboxylesterase
LLQRRVCKLSVPLRPQRAERVVDLDTKVTDGAFELCVPEQELRVPVRDSAKKSAKLIKGAKEIYYPGAPHGLTATHQDQANAELLAFLKA